MSKHGANILKAAYAAAQLTFPFPIRPENEDLTFAARHEALMANDTRYSEVFNHLSAGIKMQETGHCYTGRMMEDMRYMMHQELDAISLSLDVFELASIHRKTLGEPDPVPLPGNRLPGTRVTPEILKLRGIPLQ